MIKRGRIKYDVNFCTFKISCGICFSCSLLKLSGLMSSVMCDDSCLFGFNQSSLFKNHLIDIFLSVSTLHSWSSLLSVNNRPSSLLFFWSVTMTLRQTQISDIDFFFLSELIDFFFLLCTHTKNTHGSACKRISLIIIPLTRP